MRILLAILFLTAPFCAWAETESTPEGEPQIVRLHLARTPTDDSGLTDREVQHLLITTINSQEIPPDPSYLMFAWGTLGGYYFNGLLHGPLSAPALGFLTASVGIVIGSSYIDLRRNYREFSALRQLARVNPQRLSRFVRDYWEEALKYNEKMRSYVDNPYGVAGFCARSLAGWRPLKTTRGLIAATVVAALLIHPFAVHGVPELEELWYALRKR